MPCVRFSTPRRSVRATLLTWALVTAACATFPKTAAAKPVLTLDGHDPKSYCVAFAPDGKTVATGGADTMVRLWDLATGKEKFALEATPPGPRDERGRTHGTLAVAFTPDGKTLLASVYWYTETKGGRDYFDGGVRVWDMGTRKLRFTLTGHAQQTAVAPDGKTAATTDGPDSNDIVLWDLETGKEAGRLTGRKSVGGPLAFSADGKRLAVGGNPIELWDVATRKLWAVIPHTGHDVAIAPDGKTLAAWDGEKVNLYEVEDPDNVRLRDSSVRLDGGSSMLNALKYSPDGTMLVWGNKVLSPWSASGRRYIPAAWCGSGGGIVFSPDGKLLAVVNGCVAFYRVDDE